MGNTNQGRDYKEWVQEVFDRSAPGYGGQGCEYFDQFGRELVALASLQAGEKILDVATGKGAILFPAAEAVGDRGEAIGVDLSPAMIAEASKRAPLSKARLTVMDAEKLSFRAGTFDVVFCGFALFFLPNLSTALAEFKRVLKPQGRLAVSIWGDPPALSQWVSERARELGALRQMKAQSLDSASALKEALTRAGFSLLRIEEKREPFFHSSPEAWWESLWTHATRSPLEQLSPANLDALRKEALGYVQHKSYGGPIQEMKHVIFAIAKPHAN